MITTMIILLCLVAYVICFGIFVAICRFSKVYDSFLKALCKDRVSRTQTEGLLLTIAPLSIILMLLIYIGYGAYCVTKSLFMIFKTEV